MVKNVLKCFKQRIHFTSFISIIFFIKNIFIEFPVPLSHDDNAYQMR